MVTNPGNYGFTVITTDGVDVPISSVTLLASENKVRILTSTNPNQGLKVRYAWGVDGIQTGPTTGARGNLRDSDPAVSTYLNAAGQPYPLQNWCVHFEEDVVADFSGAVLGYRLSGPNPLQDKSGNGRTLTAVGSPSINSGGYIEATGSDYYDTGFVWPENVRDFTMLVVGRTPTTPTGTTLLCGNYVYNGPGKSDGQNFFLRNTGRPYTQDYYTIAGSSTKFEMNNVAVTTPPIIATNMTFQIVRLSGDVFSWDIPRENYSFRRTLPNTPERLSHTNVSFLVGTTREDFAPTMQRHVAEFALWDRALTEYEVAEQYAISKAAASAKGFNI